MKSGVSAIRKLISGLPEWRACSTTRRTFRVVFFPCRNFLKYAAHWVRTVIRVAVITPMMWAWSLLPFPGVSSASRVKRPGIVAVSLDVVRAVSLGGECHFQNSTIESSVYPM